MTRREPWRLIKARLITVISLRLPTLNNHNRMNYGNRNPERCERRDAISLMMIKIIMLVITLIALAGLAIYLAGLARFCLKGARAGAANPRASRPTLPQSRWRSTPRLPDRQARLTLVTTPHSNVRSIASRSCAFRQRTASTLPMAIPPAGPILNARRRIPKEI